MIEKQVTSIVWNESGLAPGIIQDVRTGAVRMLGYLSRESLQLTIETGFVHFFSRSRQRIWKKGETSGNVLEMVSITTDCDDDTLLIRVIPHGPTCHTGEETCFFGETLATAANQEMSVGIEILTELEDIIAQRHAIMPEDSYTAYLFNEGVDKIGKKIGEEAAEVIIAAKNGDPEPLAGESADLIYHLLVMLEACDVPLDDVLTALADRR